MPNKDADKEKLNRRVLAIARKLKQQKGIVVKKSDLQFDINR